MKNTNEKLPSPARIEELLMPVRMACRVRFHSQQSRVISVIMENQFSIIVFNSQTKEVLMRQNSTDTFEDAVKKIREKILPKVAKTRG